MDEFMKLAIEEAKLGISYGHGGPFGCVIVKDGKIIGKGHNKVLLLNDPTSHGEITAIRDACNNLNTFDLTGAILYTTGYPCPMCMGAIVWANIEKLYYGCNIKDAEDIGFRDKVFYEKDVKKMVVELGRDECLKLFEEYKQIEDKINY